MFSFSGVCFDAISWRNHEFLGNWSEDSINVAPTLQDTSSLAWFIRNCLLVYTYIAYKLLHLIIRFVNGIRVFRASYGLLVCWRRVYTIAAGCSNDWTHHAWVPWLIFFVVVLLGPRFFLVCSTLRVYIYMYTYRWIRWWLAGSRKRISVAARQKRTGGECQPASQPASQTAPAASLRQPHRSLLKKNFTHESRPKTWKQKKEVHTHTHTQEVVSTGASSWKINIYKNGEKRKKKITCAAALCLLYITTTSK